MSKELAKAYEPQEVEGRIYDFWMQGGYFHAEVDPKKKPYTIVIPPPNITGQLHMGHAWDETLQDILIRWKRMQGYSALWLPGTDHASIATEAKIVEAMRLGFSSIMYDCSTDTYENNIARVAQMVKIADMFGASVEGELGHVGANDESAGDDSIYTEPEQARDFAQRTGVDALAVAIGTAHGAYKEKPRLDIGRLAEISRTVPVPLVLHGGSGLSDEDFKNCVANGISKINIFTDINCAAAKAAHDFYKEGCGLTDIQNQITEAVKQETMKKMKVFGSVNRA